MKEVNIKVNADTKQAEQNLNQLGNAADQTSQEMLGVADTAFAVAETITGSFAIATGAIGLFAGENEKMQKIATKANSVIAIALGVRQLAEQKANIAILANTVATKLNAAANKTTAATMKALGIATRTTTASFKAMKIALVSTGVGALIVGLGFAIEKLMSFGKGQEENTGLTDAQTEAIKQNSIFIEKNSKQTLGLAMAQDKLGERGVILQIHLEDQERLLAKTNGMLAEAIVLHGADSIQVQRLTASQKMYQDGIISTTKAIEENNKEMEEKTIPLTELQKNSLIEEVNLRDNLQQKKISQHQFDVEMLEQEIFMLNHKLESEKLTEDEIFLLKQEIAHKEIDLNQEKLDEIQRGKEKAAEDQKLLDEQEAERNQILADSRQSNVDSAKMMFDSIGGLMKEGSKAQKTFALASIATDTATAISTLVGGTEKAALSAAAPFIGTPAYPFVYGSTKFGFYASGVAQILNNVAQAKAVLQGGDSGGGSAGGGGGGGVTYTAPYVPESAEQQGTPNVTGDGGGSPVRAFVVSTQMTNAQALDEELQLQSTL
tara:strand:+ start:365 stop:2011 length:1647 start_codon:yes stop_codon:yes gene_type:complete